MSTRVIVTFSFLVTTIVLPSETIKLTWGPAGHVIFLRNVLQNVGEFFDRFVDQMLNVNDVYNLTSNHEIEKLLNITDCHYEHEIELIERIIETETASNTEECESLAEKSRDLVDDMKISVEYCEQRQKHSVFSRNHLMHTIRNLLSARCDYHKMRFNACIALCTNAESCARAIICIGWTAFVSCADLYPGLAAKRNYFNLALQQTSLLDNFCEDVRSCLRESEYKNVRKTIFQSLADATECRKVQSLQLSTSSTSAASSVVEKDIS